MFSLKQGEKMVKIARKAIEEYLRAEKRIDADIEGRAGIFVTLEEYPSKELRGCIGFPSPVDLKRGVVEAALSAAFADPRFPQLSYGELSKITIEVSLLSIPKKISFSSPAQLLKKIEIGRDGLIIEKNGISGLLLPQVPVEFNWSKEEYLMHLCLKAGLPPDAWKFPDVEIKSFRAQIFREVSPEGRVVEVKK